LHENDNEKALFKNGLILAITSDNPPFLEIDNHNKEIIRNHQKECFATSEINRGRS
jgi:hypothetical protein